MTNIRWAAIATIHQEAGYRFVGSEKRLADGMSRDGLLLPARTPNVYTVTPKGERAYKAASVLAALRDIVKDPGLPCPRRSRRSSILPGKRETPSRS